MDLNGGDGVMAAAMRGCICAIAALIHLVRRWRAGSRPGSSLASSLLIAWIVAVGLLVGLLLRRVGPWTP